VYASSLSPLRSIPCGRVRVASLAASPSILFRLKRPKQESSPSGSTSTSPASCICELGGAFSPNIMHHQRRPPEFGQQRRMSEENFHVSRFEGSSTADADASKSTRSGVTSRTAIDWIRLPWAPFSRQITDGRLSENPNVEDCLVTCHLNLPYASPSASCCSTFFSIAPSCRRLLRISSYLPAIFP